jgi:hypothetical protein
MSQKIRESEAGKADRLNEAKRLYCRSILGGRLRFPNTLCAQSIHMLKRRQPISLAEWRGRNACPPRARASVEGTFDYRLLAVADLPSGTQYLSPGLTCSP